jgi:hypothetical protein
MGATTLGVSQNIDAGLFRDARRVGQRVHLGLEPPERMFELVNQKDEDADGRRTVRARPPGAAGVTVSCQTSGGHGLPVSS